MNKTIDESRSGRSRARQRLTPENSVVLLIDHQSGLVSGVDLVAHNPNAVAGDPYGGSAELDQNLLWRPLPAASRHATQIPDLWHIGASTHPGAGLGGGSGHLVALQLTRMTRLLR
jgi:phytoene dehydrogenase-like protein